MAVSDVVRTGDTEATLHERIKVAERALYPATIAWALVTVMPAMIATTKGKPDDKAVRAALRQCHPQAACSAIPNAGGG